MAAWPLLAHEDLEPLKITIPLEHIEFAKDNLRHCFKQERGWRAVEEDVGGGSARRGGRGRATGERGACGRPTPRGRS